MAVSVARPWRAVAAWTRGRARRHATLVSAWLVFALLSALAPKAAAQIVQGNSREITVVCHKSGSCAACAPADASSVDECKATGWRQRLQCDFVRKHDGAAVDSETRYESCPPEAGSGGSVSTPAPPSSAAASSSSAASESSGGDAGEDCALEVQCEPCAEAERLEPACNATGYARTLRCRQRGAEDKIRAKREGCALPQDSEAALRAATELTCLPGGCFPCAEESLQQPHCVTTGNSREIRCEFRRLRDGAQVTTSVQHEACELAPESESNRSFAIFMLLSALCGAAALRVMYSRKALLRAANERRIEQIVSV
jgi:hypothetical protein